MAKNYFCIDIGESFIKIADTDVKNETIEVASLGILPTDKIYFSSNLEKVIEEQAAHITAQLAKLKIAKPKVNIIIPDSVSYNQIVEMPRLNEKELLSAIKYQADQFIPMPIDEVSLDIEILYEKVREKKILTFISAAPKKTIEKVQKTLEYIGLVTDSIETEASAFGRLLTQIYKKAPIQNPQSNEGSLFINIGYSTTTLYFFNESLKLVTNIHNFNIGYHLFMKEIQVNLNKEEKEIMDLLKKYANTQEGDADNLGSVLSVGIKDFLFQIQRFTILLSEQYRSSVKSIYLFNEIIRFEGLVKITGDYFKLPARIFDISPYLKQSPVISQVKSDIVFFMPAIGGNLR